MQRRLKPNETRAQFVKRVRESFGDSQPNFAQRFDPPLHWMTISKLERGVLSVSDSMFKRVATLKKG